MGDNKMKIAIDARFFRSSTGGIGRYTRALIRELMKIDKKNDYTIYITPKDEEEYNLDRSNFSVKVVPISHYSVNEQIKFLQILNKEKFDLVHFTNFNHPIFYSGKFVVTIHDLTIMLFPTINQQKSILKKFAFNSVMQNAVWKSNKIIAISEATKADVIKYLKGDSAKIKVIYEGIDDKYQIQNIDNNKNNIIKGKYKLTDPYVLFVSQWRPHKGLPELIKAFEILKEKYQVKYKLVLVGKPNLDFPEIIKRINSSKYINDIILPGFVADDDLPYIYHNADAFIFPSQYEGFGLPPLEAMAAGTVVVSSKTSCMPEILGDAAIYFNPRNPNDIAEKLTEVLSNNKMQKDFIKKGLTHIKKYSWENMARETLKLYESICG
jgi:glycosyltransferase involved in cell wall biosynthesis